MRRDLPRAIADAASDIRTPFARALARGRAEFGRKDVRTASPRAGYSGKTFKRNAGTAVRHAAPLPRAGAHPRRIDHSADETFAHRRFTRSPPEIRKKRVSPMTPHSRIHSTARIRNAIGFHPRKTRVQAVNPTHPAISCAQQ
ncbi:hypothetical protein [Burkholderia ubonensis]|uniref:hypothetical protein n=1 Tax=Burkholderia ubonensis TaxID=101571 RepID=UPI0012F7417D|nr:hypothetical protein [Burkholderia ubonensis]